MVMHARKLPRINDGFSEKHSDHSPYESSKYSNSMSSSSKYRGTYPSDKRLDSPNNSHRSNSPDSRSQSPRYHKSSSSNLYKRDNSYRDREFNSYRDVADTGRSPKERRRDRNNEHISRNSTMKKDSGFRVGDWSEHKSSSGKKYYYNCRSEISQWEKPGEWVQWEQQRQTNSSSNNKLSSYNSSKGYSSSSSNSKSNYMKCTSSNSFSSNSNNSFSKNSHYSSSSNISSKNQSSHVNSSKEKNYDRQKIDKHSLGEIHNFRNDEQYDKIQHRKYSSGVGDPDEESSNEYHRNNKHNSSSNNSSNPTTNHISSDNYPTPGGGGPYTDPPPVSNCDTPPASQPTIPSRPHLTDTSPLEDVRDEHVSTAVLLPSSLSDIHESDQRKSAVVSLSSLAPPPTASFSPCLTNYYKETLVSHVRDWPSEAIERQSQHLAEEAHTMGSLVMTKVSADLKMARSLVRLAEIQATLHEQRILFLRAQKRELEDVNGRPSNSFMSSEPSSN